MNIIHMGGVLPVMHAYGGAVERRILELAKEQVRLGHKVAYLALWGGRFSAGVGQSL